MQKQPFPVGGGSKKFENCGGGGKKILGLEGLLLLQGHDITCHGFFK